MFLDAQDKRLLNEVTKLAKLNTDIDDIYVVAGVLTSDGEIYFGMNLHSWVGTCAELVALANARLDGYREIISAVAVRRYHGAIEIVSPCGRCRQIFNDFCPGIHVILSENDKRSIAELLPNSYVDV